MNVLPAVMRIEEDQLKSDQTVQIRVVVPRGFVQEEDVPVGDGKTDGRETIEETEGDANGTDKHEQIDDDHVFSPKRLEKIEKRKLTFANLVRIVNIGVRHSTFLWNVQHH